MGERGRHKSLNRDGDRNRDRQPFSGSAWAREDIGPLLQVQLSSLWEKFQPKDPGEDNLPLSIFPIKHPLAQMKRHEAQLHSSETPYKCRCSYHWYCYWCIKVFWILSKTSFLFSRCDRTFKSEYSWKRHQSNDEVHEKMENYKPFLTCEVSNQITPIRKSC